MKRRISGCSAFALACLISSTCVHAQAPAAAVPPPPTPTLWSFLGIPQGAQKVQGALLNRRGNLPRLEPDTPLKALNDPRNLYSKVPAIKKAAEIKQAEDLKPQKIKSIKYLTSIGCGCYDKDGSVTDALVAAMEDCTEDVRLATLNAVQESAANKCCSNCGQVCCCNEKLMKKLAEIAYERDDTGCYKEPSVRVREAAAAALRTCCPGGPPPIIESEEPKKEEPKVAPESEGDEEQSVAPESDGDDASPDKSTTPRADNAEEPEEEKDDAEEKKDKDADKPIAIRLSDREESHEELMVAPVVTNERPTVAQMRALMQNTSAPALATPNPHGGVVMSYDKSTKTAYVHFESRDMELPNGAEVHLRPDPAYGQGFHGSWQVAESLPGCAILVPLNRENVDEVAIGDHVMLGLPPVLVAPVSYNHK